MTNDMTVDLTPTPRILHILGDIPFAIWQCFAEFIDNSIDAFASADRNGTPVANPRIDVNWSNPHVPEVDQEIVISDNGTGMSLESLQNAAKAGYSSNDPIHNLGLFGMGFNIATARLGDESYFWSTRKGDAEWIGIKIDFDELVKNQSFAAPVVTKPKANKNESGTKIVIRRLRGGTYHELTKKRKTVMEQLERVYSPILRKGELKIVVDNQILLPRNLCVWDEKRFVVRKGGKIVHAVQNIDVELANSYFDVVKNRYLTEDEYYSMSEEDKKNVRSRKQHLTGWIGVQRYGHVNDYGFDFIRNGRKILIADKRLFEFVDPETGLKEVEYPVDLGSTYGGRIVGELNVDYLIPTYQKNEFLPSGNAWRLTYDAIHGAGPMQHKNRVKLGYDGDNTSVLSLMCAVFRRPEAGTENLCVKNSVAQQMAQSFFAHDPEYQSDEKWYELAQAADNGGVVPANADKDGTETLPLGGQKPTTDIDVIFDPPPMADVGKNGEPPASPVAKEHEKPKQTVVENSEMDDLLERSDEDIELSGEYKYLNAVGGLQVKAYRLVSGDIRLKSQRVPCAVFKDGIDVSYFYDPSHSTLMNYPLTPRQLLLVYLAQAFCDRDPGIAILPTFWGLMDNCLSDESINLEQLRERAKMFIEKVKDMLPALFKERMSEARKLIDEDSIDKSLFLNTLIAEAGSLYSGYQDETSTNSDVLAYVPDATLVRFIERFPNLFFDDKVFTQPYEKIHHVGNEALTNDLRRRSVAVVTGYLRDLASLVSGGHKNLSKQELLRFSNSIALLSRLIRE